MDIQVEKEQKSSVEYLLKVTVPAEVMKEQIESSLASVAKHANVPGFRKGKVPLKVVLQRYGEAVRQESVQQVLQDSYRQALTESELDPVTPGEMSEIKFDEDEPLSYTVNVEIMPEFELPDFSALAMEVQEPSASDADIDDALNGLRESSATLIPSDGPVDEHSLLTMDLQEIDASGVPIIGRSEKDIEVDMKFNYFGEEFAKRVLGLSCEEKAVFEVQGGKDADGEPRVINYEATIRNIQKKELPDVDEHFVQSINPKLATVEELRADMKKYLDARARYQARQKLYRELADELLKRVKFEVPPRMLEDYLQRMADEGTKSSGKEATEERMREFKENYRTSAIWNLRWYMLRSRVIREHSLKVEKQDLRKEIERLALIDQTSPDDYERRLSAEQRRGITDDLSERKVFDFLTEQIQKVLRPVSIAEFEGRAGESELQ